jgi:hypothetical protein
VVETGLGRGAGKGEDEVAVATLSKHDHFGEIALLISPAT